MGEQDALIYIKKKGASFMIILWKFLIFPNELTNFRIILKTYKWIYSKWEFHLEYLDSRKYAKENFSTWKVQTSLPSSLLLENKPPNMPWECTRCALYIDQTTSKSTQFPKLEHKSPPLPLPITWIPIHINYILRKMVIIH